MWDYHGVFFYENLSQLSWGSILKSVRSRSIQNRVCRGGGLLARILMESKELKVRHGVVEWWRKAIENRRTVSQQAAAVKDGLPVLREIAALILTSAGISDITAISAFQTRRTVALQSRGVKREIRGYSPCATLASDNIDSINEWRRLLDVNDDGNQNVKKISDERHRYRRREARTVALILFI